MRRHVILLTRLVAINVATLVSWVGLLFAAGAGVVTSPVFVVSAGSIGILCASTVGMVFALSRLWTAIEQGEIVPMLDP